MTNEIMIEELNTLLRGQFMGIHTFEHYIQKLDNDPLKQDFQHMQHDLKHNAQKIAERIQNLGGTPTENEGISGSVHSAMHNLMTPGDPTGMIDEALKGTEKYAIHYSEELVKGDLDPESKRIVKEVIDNSRRHAEQLKHLRQ